MDLEKELASFKAEFARTAPEGRPALYDAKIEELRASFLVSATPQVGSVAPDFRLPNVLGAPISLADARRSGPVVVTFYRGGWCPYCNFQLRAYQEILPDLERLGARLIAISPQTPDGSLSTAEQNELSFDVLSDVGNHVARDYQLVFSVAPELREIHQQMGKDLTLVNGTDDWELPVPATFVVASDGTVLLSHVDVDYRRRLAPEVVLACLEQSRTRE